MWHRWLAVPCTLLGLSFGVPAQAADVDAAVQIVTLAVGEELTANDARVIRARTWLATAMQASGETDERAVAAASVRIARHLFDVTKQRVSPLEVLEALATRAVPGRPLQEATQRYFDLRAKQKLDHAAALAAMK